MYDNNFDDVLRDADAIYQKHKPIKGESWKQMSIDELSSLLNKECVELDDSWMEEDEELVYKELLDVINVALMLAKRLKSES